MMDLRRAIRLLGTLMIVGGVLTLAWAVLVWRWQDPITALYTRWEQGKLTSTYERRFDAYRPHIRSRNLAAIERAVAVDARAYRRSLSPGDPVGRLKIGRIGLSMIVVQGTDHDTLKKGPGRDLRTLTPGQGQLIYIAGHRTTYLAPFSHIDSLRAGDRVTLELPYAVAAEDVSVLANRGREILRLQACHPRFFASHRYIVDAKLVELVPRGGRSFTLPAARLATGVTAPGS